MNEKFMRHLNGRVLLYGASGSIGNALKQKLESDGYSVWCVSTSAKTQLASKVVALEDVIEKNSKVFGKNIVFKHVIFSQGLNINDTVKTFNLDNFSSIIEANVTSILSGIKYLLNCGMLASHSTITIVSSIWQNKARANKLSYSVSKSALKGVVLSLVADLSDNGIRVNAVLPGPIDNAMTRANLTDLQINEFIAKTPMGRLVEVEEVIQAILFLMSDKASGITGNFLQLDLGFSNIETFEN